MKDYRETNTYTNNLPFPNTEAVNSTGPGNKDGTKFIKELVNDNWIFFQALLKNAGIEPNGLDDTIASSQKIKALRSIIKSYEYILPFQNSDMSVVIEKDATNFTDILTHEKFDELFNLIKNNSKMILRFKGKKVIVSAYTIYETTTTEQIHLCFNGSFSNFGVENESVVGTIFILIERNKETRQYARIIKRSNIEYICTQAKYNAIANKSNYVKYIIVSNTNAKTTIDTTINDKERNLLTVLNVSNVKQAVLKLKERTLTGDFGDLRLGDYIGFSLHTYGNQRFEIVAFDHYLNRGNPTITQHHITFMSVNILEKRQMHSTNENRYYYNRDLATYLNGTVKGALVSAIGVEPLSLPLQWDVGPTNGGGVAVSLQVYIPQIEEVLGTGTGWGTYNTRSQRHVDGDTARAQWGKPTHSSQFPLFVSYPYKIHKKYRGSVIPYWSSTPCYDAISRFSVVGVDGVAADGSVAFLSDASVVHGVPLAFNL